MNRYYDKRFDKSVMTICPGELYVSSKDEMIHTVLGSCVSVCLFDEVYGVGGMNHYKLARRVSEPPIEGDEPGRYGEAAMVLLLQKVVEAGADPLNLKAKVYGGAAVAAGAKGQISSISADNTALAFDFLAEKKIEVVSRNTGGTTARRLFFHVTSGLVLMEI